MSGFPIGTQTFHSAGKFLLSGEYLILDGALGVGLPCTLGQSLTVEIQTGSGLISWESRTKDGNAWHTVQFQYNASKLDLIQSTNADFGQRLKQVLEVCLLESTYTLESTKDYCFKTQLEFDANWGLGSSSTFIANITQFFQVDPYHILEQSFGGSGYDLAAATAKTPFFFQRNEAGIFVEEKSFEPDFLDELFFVYLNQKQDSRAGIKHYQSLKPLPVGLLKSISDISKAIVQATNQAEFCDLLDEHESQMADFLGLSKVKDEYFSDFQGTVKSLGAWGGDFVLASSSAGFEYLKSYFETKGYPIILPYKTIIKT